MKKKIVHEIGFDTAVYVIVVIILISILF